MMFRVIVGVFLQCILLSQGSALNCYNCVFAEGSVNLRGGICESGGSMTSSDCDVFLGGKFVQSKYGYLPEVIAKPANLTGEVVTIRAEDDHSFLCINAGFSTSGDLGTIDINFRSCIAELLTVPVNPTGNTRIDYENILVAAVCNAFDKINDDAYCRTCQTNECNSSSRLVTSLLICLTFVLSTRIW